MAAQARLKSRAAGQPKVFWTCEPPSPISSPRPTSGPRIYT